MRSTTIRLATALGVTLALAVCALPQASFAQAGSVFQDQGIDNDIGGSGLIVSHGAYAQTHPRQAAAQAPAYTREQVSTLPGYSARPAGMCWERPGGGVHESAGHWAACKSH
jgi:hypothetical protein